MQVPKPVAAAKTLSFKANGIAAAPRLVVLQKRAPSAPVAAAPALDIQCADGPRGCKLKTRKSASKRFKITGSGKIMARHAGKNHFQEKKGSKRRKALKVPLQVSETHMRLIKGCLPYAGIQ
jgi:large subunit ribosomal protein L35